MDATSFRYLISLAVSKNLEMRLMDVVTACLYGSLDNDIYMKILEGFKMSEALSAKPKEIFIKKTTSGYVIIAVYVADLNIIGTNKEILEVIQLLKKEFEMKDLGKTKYCHGLQIEYMSNKILVHQSNYTKKSIETFQYGQYAGYLSDPHKVRSQTGYIFMNGGTAISWRSQKQTLVAIFSNHAEVIALNEAIRECTWLRSMIQLVLTSCGLEKDIGPTLIYEDNSACVTQMKEGYIKSDRKKHIPPKFF
ncbi:uncharacterized protein LOC111898724 [Lactuca sativa]|uniref:uncharacterized protein LOC111898724 n=1 Tax=Lactuca sativa TaxID=4236 RepID=UPI000CD9BDE2|nr:uncharacterized protein LOC111898724 [Lactuca sativa]